MNYDHIKLLIKIYDEIQTRANAALSSEDLVADVADIKTLSEAYVALSAVCDQQEKVALYKKQIARIPEE